MHLDAGAGATRPLTATLTLHSHAHPLTHPDLRRNLQVLAPGGASLFTPGRNGTEALYATRGLEPRPNSLQPAPSLPAHSSLTRAVCLASPRVNFASPRLARRRARLEVGQPLVYSTRWRQSPTREGSWVVDRAYNTQAISAASMGAKAVQNCEAKGADQVETAPKP